MQCMCRGRLQPLFVETVMKICRDTVEDHCSISDHSVCVLGRDSERASPCLRRWRGLARFWLVSLLGGNLNPHLLSPL